MQLAAAHMKHDDAHCTRLNDGGRGCTFAIAGLGTMSAHCAEQPSPSRTEHGRSLDDCKCRSLNATAIATACRQLHVRVRCLSFVHARELDTHSQTVSHPL